MYSSDSLWTVRVTTLVDPARVTIVVQQVAVEVGVVERRVGVTQRVDVVDIAGGQLLGELRVASTHQGLALFTQCVGRTDAWGEGAPIEACIRTLVSNRWQQPREGRVPGSRRLRSDPPGGRTGNRR